jgi:hypothetical protein
MDNATRIHQRIKNLRSQNISKKQKKKCSYSKLFVKNSAMRVKKKTTDFLGQTDVIDSKRLILISSNPSVLKIPDPVSYYGKSQECNSDSDYDADADTIKKTCHKRSISLNQNAPICNQSRVRKDS